MISTIVSRLVILLFGTLYPAYASYKAVRTKNVKEYVKWMMYWIVFALFTCAETFTDVFLSFWFPFYYEIKIIIVIWLLSPATKGSSILYRKFVHPMLCKREQEIDEYISRAKEQGYHTMLHLGSKGVTYATNVIMQTAIKSLPPAPSSSVIESQQQKVIIKELPQEYVETSDESRPSTPTKTNTARTEQPTAPAQNTRSRKTRSQKTVKAK